MGKRKKGRWPVSLSVNLAQLGRGRGAVTQLETNSTTEITSASNKCPITENTWTHTDWGAISIYSLPEEEMDLGLKFLCRDRWKSIVQVTIKGLSSGYLVGFQVNLSTTVLLFVGQCLFLRPHSLSDCESWCPAPLHRTIMRSNDKRLPKRRGERPLVPGSSCDWSQKDPALSSPVM